MCLQCRRPWFNSWVGKIHWRRDRLPTPVFLGFPCASAGKEFTCMRETWSQSLGWEDPLEKGKATHSSQYSGLENSMDCIIHGVANSWIWLSDFHFQYLRSLRNFPSGLWIYSQINDLTTNFNSLLFILNQIICKMF